MSKLKCISMGVLLGLSQYTFADVLNLMGDGSNVIYATVSNPSSSNYGSFFGLDYNGAGEDDAISYQPDGNGHIVPVISTFGVNAYIDFGSIEPTDLSTSQYSVPTNGRFTVGQGITRSSLIAAPTVHAVMVAPPDLLFVSPGQPPLEIGPPIYHITISGTKYSQVLQNTSYVTPYELGYTVPSTKTYIKTYTASPISLTTQVNGSSQAVSVGTVDFYYQGYPTAISVQQNLDRLGEPVVSDPPSTNATIDLTKTGYGELPIMSADTCEENNPLTITMTAPASTPVGSALPVAANGMDQSQVKIQIALDETDSTGTSCNYKVPIATNDPKYGWLYNMVYFVNHSNNTIVTNTYTPAATVAMSQTVGPYPYGISSSNLLANKYKGFAPVKSGNTQAGVYYFSANQPGSSTIVPAITYYLATDSNNQNGAGMTTVTSYADNANSGQNSNALIFTAQNQTFNAISWDQSQNTVRFSSTLANPQSLGTDAVYLNMNNPRVPLYVGFKQYEAVPVLEYSGGTYDNVSFCSGALITNNDQALTCAGFNQQATAVATNAIDEYGNYYVTSGFGN